MTSSNVDVKDTATKLGLFQRFVRMIKDNDEKGLEDRVAAVTAVFLAAIETRQYVEKLKNNMIPLETDQQTAETRISELWYAASRQMWKFDKILAEECIIKAFGWGTGNWNDESFAIIPRRVEEVYADALKLLKEYQPLLTEKVVQ
jgi:hypothetical protein